MQTQSIEMTQAEYARHRGVSKQAISKAVGKKKIQLLANGKIDAAAADLALGENVERVNVQDEQRDVVAPRATGAGADLTRAKVASEIFSARLAELKYGRESGKYVEAAGIADAAANCGEAVVRIIRTLSSKSELLHAASVKDGAAGVKAALKSIEFDLLTRASDAYSKMAGASAAGSSEVEGETEQ